MADIEMRVERLENRTADLESWRAQELVNAAVQAEQSKAVQGRFDRLDSSVKEIRDGLWRAFWIIASAVILAMAGWVLKGGLSL